MLKAGRVFENRASWRTYLRPATILGLGILSLACGPLVRSQFGGNNPFGTQERTQHDFPHANVSNGANRDQVATERQKIALNLQRQKQIVDDSDKLLKLARELNDEVAAAGSRSLTSDQIEKLNEIEKLARGVKERMLDRVDEPAPAVSQYSVEY